MVVVEEEDPKSLVVVVHMATLAFAVEALGHICQRSQKPQGRTVRVQEAAVAVTVAYVGLEDIHPTLFHFAAYSCRIACGRMLGQWLCPLPPSRHWQQQLTTVPDQVGVVVVMLGR